MLRCAREPQKTPETLYRSINDRFVAGELQEAAKEAGRAERLVAGDGPLWAAKFRLQRARIAVYGGNSAEALPLLETELPPGVHDPALAVTRDSLLSIAYTRTGDLPRAEAARLRAERECPDEATRGEMYLAQGVMAVEKGHLGEAQHAFEQSLASAQGRGDRFLQMQALLNTAVVAEQQDHYEDALELYNQASVLARVLGARQALEKAEGGAGSALYQIGDFPHALLTSQAAEEHARALGSTLIDQAEWLQGAGMSQYRLGDLKAARLSFERALGLARSIRYIPQMVDAQVALASLSLAEGDLPGALAGSRSAARAAEGSGVSDAVMQPAVVEATVLARQGELGSARGKLLSLLGGGTGSLPRPFVRWQIESELARIADAAGNHTDAVAWFERALETFHLQRQSLSKIESRLPFLENGTGLYLDYMEEQLREGKNAEALSILDRSRGETLAEGAASAKQSGLPAEASLRDPAAIARGLHGTILVYCLRPQTSYLWAVGANGSSFFRLPGQEVIQPLVESYTRAILAGRDVLAQENGPGRELFHALVEPADGLIRPGGKVYVIADGALSHLNFETLLVPGLQAHFWIEDVDIVNAKSLSLLREWNLAKRAGPGRKKLLLVGDPVYSRSEYGKLPHAAEEVTDVAGHFGPGERLLLTGAQATRAAYLSSHPAEYRYIHFVAHATASEINPLDSAVVLSAQPGEPESYKLYARDILDSRIQADVVTISACFGSGVRAYSGEGLVGLAWSFLRAGSRHVVGALWEVSDASTPQLMDDLYRGLAAGRSPDLALRSAKLAMIRRGGIFRKPFYWAAFQLYSGA